MAESGNTQHILKDINEPEFNVLLVLNLTSIQQTDTECQRIQNFEAGEMPLVTRQNPRLLEYGAFWGAWSVASFALI